MSVFPWPDFRTIKGAIRLHVGLNHSGYLPEFVAITEGSIHEVNIGKLLSFPKGSIIAMDKGYNGYSWYKQLTDKEIFFVTRLKTNTKYRVVSRRSVLKNKGLACDQIIEFTGAQCVYLILAFIKLQSGLSKSMQQILRLLQLNLFEKLDLMDLLRGELIRDNNPDINQLVLI
ncbi:MAG: transposase [Gammaproteobacteria bacterium]|nr:transposase [Gammaproteobacteria bacterium]